MKIRLAEKDDIESICRLYNEFFNFNARQQPQSYKKAVETGAYPQSVMDSKTEDIFVAVDGREIVGILHVSEEKTPPFSCFVPHKFANIVDVFLKEKFRKKGIGALLLESAGDWAKSRNLDYIELNVLAENENGIRFYEHEKFKTVSQIMRYTL